MKETLKAYEEKMTKTINVLVKDLAAIRAGRANPAVLDKLTIEYYGTPTPLNQVAAVSTPEPRTLQIQPWDASTLKAIEKAIFASDLGLNPQNDGKSIRLNFPPLTEERRRELIKQVSKTGEESKVALRNIRRDANDTFKSMKKDNKITEDGQKEAEEKMQKITDKFVKEVDGIVAKKSKELAEV
ncbi:MAG: ribosome recycling factor [Butyricicoccus sp.]